MQMGICNYRKVNRQENNNSHSQDKVGHHIYEWWDMADILCGHHIQNRFKIKTIQKARALICTTSHVDTTWMASSRTQHRRRSISPFQFCVPREQNYLQLPPAGSRLGTSCAPQFVCCIDLVVVYYGSDFWRQYHAQQRHQTPFSAAFSLFKCNTCGITTWTSD